jgi:general secretion pathway protein L
MSDAMLYLRPRGSSFQWLILDGDVVSVRGEGTADDFDAAMESLAFEGPARLLIPAEDVLLTSADVPSRQAKQVAQAVPFVIEEALAADIDECHFAIGVRNPSGAIPVAVIETVKLRSMLDALGALGLNVVAARVDALCLPGKFPQLVVDPQRLHLRTGLNEGLGLEREHLSTVLELLDRQQLDALTIRVAGDVDIGIELASINGDGEVTLAADPLLDDVFELMCRDFDAAPLEMLQGDFKVAEVVTQGSGGWRSVAILAACAFFLHVLLLSGQGIYMSQQAAVYESQATELYRTVFPADKNVRDLRRRWRNHLGGSAGSADGAFISVFGTLAAQLPGSQLTLNNVNFNESRGDLILQFEAGRSEELVSFSQTLTGLGLDAEIGTITQEEDRVRGTIKVGTGG